MRVPGKGRYAPPRDEHTEQREGDCDWRTEAGAPGVVEADVSDAVEAVVKGDEEERDVDGDEPGVLEEAALDDFECESGGRAHFSGKVLDPKVHDQQEQQRCSCNPLQIPINRSSAHFNCCLNISC